MNDAAPRTPRLILWPAVITLLIIALRLAGEVNGWIHVDAGGSFALLGITWCVFLFGGWFGRRLSNHGYLPRMQRAWVWMLVLALVLVGGVMWSFAKIDPKDASDAGYAALREQGMIAGWIALAAMVATFVVWRRLAWTLFCYGLVARLGVLAATWLAKTQGWETHHVKFGPASILRPTVGETVGGAAYPQLLFWVPFTVVMGTLTGSLFARRRPITD